MTWSYDPSIADTTDEVRLNLGDTNTNDQIFSNEEIAHFLSEHNSNVNLATAFAAEAAAGKFSRDKDRSAVGMSSNLGDRYTRFMGMAAKYRAKAGVLAEVDVGGVSVARAQTIESNSDFLKPFATRSRFDNG